MPSTGISSATATSMRPSSARSRSGSGGWSFGLRRGAVQRWIEVGAAGQQQPVEAAGVVGRIDVLSGRCTGSPPAAVIARA